MATKASSSLSPCIRLMEESLLLPMQDAGLFAKTFLLIFAHTFIFIAVAVHFAHPLATSILADIRAHKSTPEITTDTASSNHSKELSLLAIYLSYLASKLATQLVTSLATATTYSGERLSRKAVKERIGGLLGTAALAGVLELSFTALLVLLLVSTWTYADSGIQSLCGYSMFLVALLLYLYLATVIPVSIAVSAVDRGCHSVWALRRAWRLMRARRKEAAVLVFVVNLLPAVVYPYPVPMYAFLSGTMSSQDLWLVGAISGSDLPFVGAQLFSMVAATMFCCLSMETNYGASTPVV
ncbi:uncharacterized protein [Miscanthus floridulus]|uniref:uncharacterized protein n=1 Tax=Miscanthus floridulus TaxID=154761 RepID=UPI003458C866